MKNPLKIAQRISSREEFQMRYRKGPFDPVSLNDVLSK